MSVLNHWLTKGVLILVGAVLSLTLSAAGWYPSTPPTLVAALPPGNAVTDARALLRLALPIDNQPVRQIQESIDDISNQIRGKQWGNIKRDITKAARTLHTRRGDLLASVVPAHQSDAEVLLEQIDVGLTDLKGIAELKDREQMLQAKAEVLDLVGALEADMVQQYPFEVPEEYSNLPQLLGRATVALNTSQGEVSLVVDGYNAPVTAGNFVDLVQRQFYDGLEFIRAEQSYVLQVGDPPGPDQGFIDPATGKYRSVPMEIMVKGDKQPTYGTTLEDAGRYLDQPVLPFSAYGTVAMARPGNDVNGGSSQFFFLLFEPELTPAGLNLLDGRYAVFGYVVDGQDVLGKLHEGDKIESAKVVSGLEYLVEPPSA